MSSPECFYRTDSDLEQSLKRDFGEIPLLDITQTKGPLCMLRMFEDDEACLNPTLSEEECPIAREYLQEIEAMRKPLVDQNQGKLP